MAADAGVFLVLPVHHGHGVPADQALDAPFERAVARIGNLVLHRNGIDVSRVQLNWNIHPSAAGARNQSAKQRASTVPAFLLQELIEGFQPLRDFLFTINVRSCGKFDYRIHRLMQCHSHL